MYDQPMNYYENPVSGPTDKDIALQSSSAANQLAALNSGLQCKIEFLQHELEVARREKRKAIVDEKLAKVNDYDMIGVVTTYTDNSNNIDIFIQNFPWPLVFMIVVCTDWTLRKDYVVIMAGAKASNGCCFMIEKSKLGHSGLLQEMLQKNGAKFNPSIARNRRMRILERHFCSPETCNEKKFILKALSGWDSNYRFHSRENSDVWEEALKKEHLPVYDKSFSRTLPEQGDLIQYIQAFRLIGDKRTRCILLLYPFLGLLGSLLQQQYDSQNFYLNLNGQGYVLVDRTKSHKNGIAFISSSVVSALLEQKQRQEEWKAIAGVLWNNPDDLVFTNELGGYLVHGTVRRHFKWIMRDLGLDETRSHDMRHRTGWRVLFSQSTSPLIKSECQRELPQENNPFSLSFIFCRLPYIEKQNVWIITQKQTGHRLSAKILSG